MDIRGVALAMLERTTILGPGSRPSGPGNGLMCLPLSSGRNYKQ
uniref:Uncharacterized protein n=1 Tax=Arundo donax TaxID=35708 RepID=A0A0A9CIL8_ARUDO